MKTLAVIILLLFSCQQKEVQTPAKEHQASAVLWQQQAAEYRALVYQAYNLARLRLDQDLAMSDEQKRAVVVDVDETVLDNTKFNAQLILDDLEYDTEGWMRWSEHEEADTVPGALSFLNYADSRGVDIFYVSNRRVTEVERTKNNLAKYSFPQLEDGNFLFRENTSSKEERRNKISETHRIVLLVGDNLGDFADVFEKKNNKDRRDQVDQLRDEFGHRFIVTPNPFYGEWENAIYNYDYTLSAKQKREKRLKTLIGYGVK